MSVEATSWAWQQTTTSSGQRLVLLALCDHMADHEDQSGLTAWPSASRLAAMTGLTESTVYRHLDGLVDLKLIVKVQRRTRRNGTLSTWLYQVDTSTHPRVDETTHPRVDETTHPRVDGTVSENPKGEPRQERAAPSDEHTALEASSEWERARELVTVFADCVEAAGYRRPSESTGAVRDMERLVRLDGREPDAIVRVARWLSTSNDPIAQFWQPNIRTPGKLRSHWDTIAGQVRRERERRTPGNTGSATDRIREANRSTGCQA